MPSPSTASESCAAAGREGTLRLLALGLGSWILLSLFLEGRGFDPDVGDPAAYLRGARTLREGAWPKALFDCHHQDQLPGYPLLIAALLPLRFLDGIAALQVLAGTAWILGILVARRILLRLGLEERDSILGAACFGLFPCVGLVYALFPLADVPALFLCALALLSLLEGRPGRAAAALAGATLLHKIAWPVAGLMAAVALLRGRMRRLHAAAAFVPLAAYAAALSVHRRDPLWLIAGNVEHGAQSGRRFPLLDGILQTLLAGLGGDLPELAQGLLAAAILLGAAALLLGRGWRREPLLLSAIVPVLLWGLLSNANLVWGVARYGKLLVLPLALELSLRRPGLRRPRGVPAAVVVLLLASQLAFGWYTARLYR